MTGHRKWSDIRRRGDEAREARVAEYRRELDEAMSLAELRQAHEMTQAELAKALDLSQPGVSRIEHQTDLYLSTLRSYVRALGGQLEIVARFPQVDIPIRGFENLASPTLDMGKVAEQATKAVTASYEQLSQSHREIDRALNAVRTMLEADQDRVQKLTRQLSAALTVDNDRLNELSQAMSASNALALERLRESLSRIKAPEVRTVPGTHGWQIRVASDSGDEAFVALRTKRDAVTAGRMIARSTGGTLVIYRRDGSVMTRPTRPMRPSKRAAA